jgi:tetratricopeptide (TPR) repeat protein
MSPLSKIVVVTRFLFATVMLLATLALGAPVARADARTEKAREHYFQGDAYYKLDKYKEALAEYEQAYIAKSDPSFLYNIAQCHRLMGNTHDAVKFYKRFLKDQPTAANRAVAEKHIRELEGHASAPPSAVKPAPPAAPPRVEVVATSSLPAAQPATATASAMPAPAAASPTLALSGPPPEYEPGQSITFTQSSPEASNDNKGGAFYTRWWFWGGVGAVAVGGLLLFLATRSDCETGRNCK